MRYFTQRNNQRKYIKVRRSLTNFFEYADAYLPDIYSIGIDKEGTPYYVKRDSEANCDTVTFNLYRAIANISLPKYTIEAWAYFRQFPEQQYGYINNIDCVKSKGHGTALMKSLIRFAYEKKLSEIHGEMSSYPPNEQGIRQYNFYTKFKFRIEEDEKGGHPITLLLPPLDEQKRDQQCP